MMMPKSTVQALSASALLLALTVSLRAEIPTGKPEDVGLSSERLRRVSELMQRHIAAGTFSGAVTLVARHGRVVHHEAQGLMDLEAKKPMQKDAIFRIMSMTKPVVGVSILMLVEEGKVRLTDPVSRFIPELKELRVTVPNSDGAMTPSPFGANTAPLPTRTVPAQREITVRDLLTHTSGVVSGGASAAQARDVGAKPGETLAQVIPRLKDVPLDFHPGARWAYSGQYGFDVLARVVEVASGMRFDQFTKQRIFDPLSMRDTFFYPTDGNPRVVTLYQRVDGALRRQANSAFMNGSYFSGGGGLFSTGDDYIRFAMMLLNGGALEGKRLLGSRTVELMASVFAPAAMPGRNAGEGFGLSVRVIEDSAARNTYLSKGSYGWSGAFNTHFFIDPAENLVGMFLTQIANLDARGEIRNDFETAVMQAIVRDRTLTGTN
jgi:CubicO group peptidase (beta-lactamase class C family)